jgi:hypothetical protein
MRVRPRVDSDPPVVESFLARRHSSRVARLGAVERPLEHPGLIAEEDGRLIGLLTYGFRLAALYAGAVDDCRARLKPEIPQIGDHGIPLRDELELELDLPF